MTEFRTTPTPNPNSIKITTGEGQFTQSGMESFSTAEDAEGHPFAPDLLSITGVEDIFMMPDFLTVTKQQGASWDLILPKVKQVLQKHFEG